MAGAPGFNLVLQQTASPLEQLLGSFTKAVPQYAELAQNQAIGIQQQYVEQQKNQQLLGVMEKLPTMDNAGRNFYMRAILPRLGFDDPNDVKELATYAGKSAEGTRRCRWAEHHHTRPDLRAELDHFKGR